MKVLPQFLHPFHPVSVEYFFLSSDSSSCSLAGSSVGSDVAGEEVDASVVIWAVAGEGPVVIITAPIGIESSSSILPLKRLVGGGK